MPSIEKAEMKIAVLRETISLLEAQHENAHAAVHRAAGARGAAKAFSDRFTGMVQGFDQKNRDGDIPDKTWELVRPYLMQFLNVTEDTRRQYLGTYSERCGRVAAVGDSIRATEKLVRMEQGKIQAELEKAAEAKLCDVCEIFELVDEDDDACEKCAAYIARYDRDPGEKLLEKWRAEHDG